MRGASRREACVRRRGRRRSGSNRRSNGLWSEQVRTGAPSGAGGMVGYDERRTTGSVPWVRTSGRPSFFFVPGSGEGAERIGGRAVRVRRRVTERGRERSGWAASCAVCVRSRSLDGWRPAVCPMRRRVTERGRERQRAAESGRERPVFCRGRRGRDGVQTCNLPGQAMQRIPPVYYLCR